MTKSPSQRRSLRLRIAVAISGVMALSRVSSAVFYVEQSNPHARDFFASGSERQPFKTLAAACRKAQAGDTVYVKNGVYREMLVPRHSGTRESPITFEAIGSQVWIKGSDVVTHWRRERGFWVRRPWRPRFYYDPAAMDDISKALYRSSARQEQVFIGGRPLQWYPEKRLVKENGFWWAPDGSEIALKLPPDINPNHIETEIPLRPAVVAAWPETDCPRSVSELRSLDIKGQSLPEIDWIIIRGFKFAHNVSTLNRSGVRIQGEHWLFENNLVEWMNTVGISIDNYAVFRGNVTRYNGQTGFGGSGDGALLENNISLWDNQREFSTSWGGAALKFARTNGLSIKGQITLGGGGPGIWCDVDCINTLVENCVLISSRAGPQGGSHGGIFYEISYNALLQDNVIFGNHSDFDPNSYGCALTISSSTGVTARRNVGIFCDGGASIVGGPRNDGPTGPFWKAFGLNAYYSKQDTLEDNLFVGDVVKSASFQPSALNPDFSNHFSGNAFVSAGPPKKLNLDTETFPSILEGQPHANGLINNTQVFRELAQAPEPIRARLDWASSRLLRALEKISDFPFAIQEPITLKAIWSFPGTSSQALFIHAGQRHLLLVDNPVPAPLLFANSGKVRIWDSARIGWRSSRPKSDEIRHLAPAGLSIVTGLEKSSRPLP